VHVPLRRRQIGVTGEFLNRPCGSAAHGDVRTIDIEAAAVIREIVERVSDGGQGLKAIDDMQPSIPTALYVVAAEGRQHATLRSHKGHRLTLLQKACARFLETFCAPVASSLFHTQTARPVHALGGD
jgi:hypothetical protein